MDGKLFSHELNFLTLMKQTAERLLNETLKDAKFDKEYVKI